MGMYLHTDLPHMVHIIKVIKSLEKEMPLQYSLTGVNFGSLVVLLDGSDAFKIQHL